MNTCKNCKFFGEEIVTYDGEDWEEVKSEFHECERIYHCKDMRSVLQYQSKAVVVDGGGYFAALRVAEDFGCIHFEETT